MGYPETFTGYAALNQEDGKKLKVTKHEYKPKEWSEYDIDIKVSACGICGSCLHTLTSGWGESVYPCVVGHEVVGTVAKAGSKSGWKEGQRVGVGAQAGSCLECEWCKKDKPMYCTGKLGMVGAYQGKWEDGSTSQGGYADYMRCRGAFAVAIPEGLSDEVAAPMMCGGVTTYSPLKRFGAGPGKKVAIIGLGGLGHFGVLWSVGLGAETYIISHSDHKKQDAEKFGIPEKNFIVTSDAEATLKEWKSTFDLIVCTSFQKDMPLETLYLPLVKPEGTMVVVGVPEEKLPRLGASSLIMKGVSLAGSIIGGPGQISEMLEFADKKGIKSWIQTYPMDQVNDALQQMNDGKARYRIVLKN